ncbi:MAG: tRNA (guanosine(46)-N7)-methyltransferase TrmB [Alphaproteobacteria bacterium]|nr:tRNA (guanosine(46)-N7)-methyltransferase TrmB [Alphaproteobacteria bacterium]
MPSQERYLQKIYGRRQAKGLRPERSRLYETLLPDIAVPDSANSPLDLHALFPQDSIREIWLEIGFGGGEHLAWQAERRPQVGFIGAEPFLDGVGRLLKLVHETQLTNVRILHGDARPLLEALPTGSLGRIFLLHPDPWPKKRHHKRRMASRWFFREAARTMNPGGVLRIASDIPDYIRWTLMNARSALELEWLAESALDWQRRPDDWPQTRYERKALLEGRQPTYLQFRRRGELLANATPQRDL